MFPITNFIVEDIKAISKQYQKRWNSSFSHLEVGKNWFYSELSKLGNVITKAGYETKELRDKLGLKKSSQKLANIFEAHCVDSWVLANSIVGGHTKPDNIDLLLAAPLRFHRRQLHRLQSEKGGVRKLYGSTRSLGFKRGSLIKHIKYGIVYVGGYRKNGISLHSLNNGIQLHTQVKLNNCKFLTYNSWRVRFSLA